MQISANQMGLTAGVAGVGPAGAGANKGADDGFDSWNIGDTLSDNDKKLVGWDPGSGKINTAANALSAYRHSGAITGEVSNDFVDALKTSIANSGGWPASPAALMSKGAQQSPLTSDTAAALFAILNQDKPASA
jgi:hypothetical protein